MTFPSSCLPMAPMHDFPWRLHREASSTSRPLLMQVLFRCLYDEVYAGEKRLVLWTVLTALMKMVSVHGQNGTYEGNDFEQAFAFCAEDPDACASAEMTGEMLACQISRIQAESPCYNRVAALRYASLLWFYQEPVASATIDYIMRQQPLPVSSDAFEEDMACVAQDWLRINQECTSVLVVGGNPNRKLAYRQLLDELSGVEVAAWSFTTSFVVSLTLTAGTLVGGGLVLPLVAPVAVSAGAALAIGTAATITVNHLFYDPVLEWAQEQTVKLEPDLEQELVSMTYERASSAGKLVGGVVGSFAATYYANSLSAASWSDIVRSAYKPNLSGSDAGIVQVGRNCVQQLSRQCERVPTTYNDVFRGTDPGTVAAEAMKVADAIVSAGSSLVGHVDDPEFTESAALLGIGDSIVHEPIEDKPIGDGPFSNENVKGEPTTVGEGNVRCPPGEFVGLKSGDENGLYCESASDCISWFAVCCLHGGNDQPGCHSFYGCHC
jgi:hypothetical protein